ncbi:GNAT family N-acetyltransferase [Algoriphagus sediminis]|uniref:GNAT family N-acetyltransferase n=1 Tax=Algoriphagus sediminis TaxID=3057113 RepID=A0ABT7Y990_9BACT|nr:GNAT family N-acetyltransferase [Algoriphagus sediminis]MDN3203072.1 GNAT family N-acetyltransferase [Algoriphagus sediminis]
MSLEVEVIRSPEAFKAAMAIREQAFVIEQGVAPEDECDQYEESSTHFLVRENGNPIGTARWRFTKEGVKIERVAVKKQLRGRGIGSVLVKAVLDNIESNEEAKGKMKYLNSQINAITLYERYGFEKVGEMFEECNILHYRMELKS